MEKPLHNSLGGLDPVDLLKQGVAEDTVLGDDSAVFQAPSLDELAGIFTQFEVLEFIGQGGMGAVYKVRQRDLDRIVALKILPPAIGRSSEFSARFAREAKALAKLNHPGIVTIHEFGERDGLHFILMEFVEGVNLAQLMKAGRISPHEALAIVPQICDALQFAHDQGIVHRDIKPENILLDRRGRVKVADFGIAKVMAADCENLARSDDRHELENVTIAGNVMGTPAYMAPEQIEHPSDVDHRADIYALGVVFYQMLTGELPEKQIELPSKKVHIDVRLDEIVLQAMEKSPELRFQQAGALRTRVDEVGTPPGKPEAPTAKSHSVGRLIAIVCGTVGGVVLAFGIAMLASWLWSSSESKQGARHSVGDEASGQSQQPVKTIEVMAPPEGFSEERNLQLAQDASLALEKAMEAKTAEAIVEADDTDTPLVIGSGVKGKAVQLEFHEAGLLEPDDITVLDLKAGTAARMPEETLEQAKLPDWSLAYYRADDTDGFTGKVSESRHFLLTRAKSFECALMPEGFDPEQEIAAGPVAIAEAFTDGLLSMQLGESALEGRWHAYEMTLSEGRTARGFIRFRAPVGPSKTYSLEWTMVEDPQSRFPDIGDVTLIEMGPDESLSLDGEFLDAAAMREKLKNIATVNADIEVMVKADNRTKFDRVQKIVGQLAELGIHKVVFSTVKSEPNEPPELSKLDWLDQALAGPDNAWLPSGGKVSSSGWMPPAIEVDTSNPSASTDHPRFLCLWFTHPLFDTLSVTDVSLLTADGGSALKPPAGHWASSPIAASSETAEMGWITSTLCVGIGSEIPANAVVSLRYSLGSWRFLTDIPANFHGTKALAEGLSVSDTGQNSDGDAFVQIISDTRPTSRNEQYDFVVVTKDGRRTERSRLSTSSAGTAVSQRFTFPMPLDRIESFEFRKRPIMEISWPIVLMNSPDKNELVNSGREGVEDIARLSSTNTAREVAVVAQAETWLAGIDSGDYARSWKDSSAFFQKSITRDAWKTALTRFRKPLGEVEKRKLLDARSVKSLPGVPDGDHVLIRFNTSFAGKRHANETVTFMLGKDGSWNAAGYYIR